MGLLCAIVVRGSFPVPANSSKLSVPFVNRAAVQLFSFGLHHPGSLYQVALVLHCDIVCATLQCIKLCSRLLPYLKRYVTPGDIVFKLKFFENKGAPGNEKLCRWKDILEISHYIVDALSTVQGLYLLPEKSRNKLFAAGDGTL